MGLFNKKPLLSENDEKISEIRLMAYELLYENEEKAEKHLKGLDKEELNNILKLSRKEYVNNDDRGFNARGSVSIQFPNFDKALTEIIREKESKEGIKKGFNPFGSFLKNEKGSLLGGERPNFGFIGRIKGLFKSSDDEFFHSEKKGELGKKSIDLLFRKITFQLSDFWGIPRNDVVRKMPSVSLVELPKQNSTITWFDSTKNTVTINKTYLENYDDYKDQLFNSLEPALAEESCHFLETMIKIKADVKADENVKEFFGIISRLYVAEGMNIVKFKEEYKKLFAESMNFTKRLEQSQRNIEKIFDDSENKMIEIEKQLVEQDDVLDSLLTKGADTDEIEAIKVRRRQLLEQMWRETGKSLIDIDSEAKSAKHLTYYPAYSFYYYIRKMRPVERFELLKENPDKIIETVLEPQEIRLENLRSRLSEVSSREEEIDRIIESKMQNSFLETKNYVETDRFFENVENEVPHAQVPPAQSRAISVPENAEPEPAPSQIEEEPVHIPIEGSKRKKVVLNVNMTEKEMKKAGIKF
jgi:hypothetical protein